MITNREIYVPTPELVRLKSFEEFEQEILNPNRIKLPDLPPDHDYSFDSEKGELIVIRPRK